MTTILTGAEGVSTAGRTCGIGPGEFEGRACSPPLLAFQAGASTAKVTRLALQNAASIAALFLTTEAVVAEKPEKSAPAMPGDRCGMGHDEF